MTKEAIEQKGKVTKDTCRTIGRLLNPTEDKFVHWTMVVKCIPSEKNILNIIPVPGIALIILKMK
ncbi:MAG: hypothetical protein ABIL02_06655 [candidate division WOR-3 bacterium]